MRGHPGTCLALGNYPAARRFVRNRKPPPIILWAIGIITCLLFLGAAAMLTVGYLNPYGTVGLAILGVGAVVYFGGIIFLVLSCLWVERKYPGMQPLSFKIYSRKPNRIPPTTFTNPNVSGQMPADTTPNFRMHNELPIQVPGLNDNGRTTDKSSEKKDNNPPSHGSSPGHAKNPKGKSTPLDILQEEDYNGGIGDADIRLQAQTNNDSINMNEDTGANVISTAVIEEKSESQGAAETHDPDQSKTAQYKQSENGNNVSANLKRERKVKFKTHHIEVPFEDYPNSNSSAFLSNEKDKSQDSQEAKPKNNSQPISASTENEKSPTKGASKNSSSTKTSTTDNQKEASSSVNNQSQAMDNYLQQKTKIAERSAANVKDVKQEFSNPSTTHKSRFIEKKEKPQDGLQSTSSSEPAGSSPVNARKNISGKYHQNSQESSQRVRGLTPTNSASPPAVKKIIDHASHAAKPTHSVTKDSEVRPKSSPVSARKLLDIHKKNATNPQESVEEKSQTSSPLNIGENMLLHKKNLRHDQENMTSTKHRTQTPGSPGSSPTRAQKVQSPERARKLRKDDAVPNSPPAHRKTEGSSSPQRHHQTRTDNFSKAQRTQEQSLTIQTFASSGRIEETQKK